MGWRSQQYGSFERFLVALARASAAAGARTHLVFTEPPASRAFADDVDADLHVLARALRPFSGAFARGLDELIASTGATHLHAHFGLDQYEAVRAGRRHGLACFATKHIVPGRSRLTASRLRHRWLGRNVRTLFAVSNEVRNELIALGVPAERILVSHLGVDPDAYRPDPEARAAVRAELGLASGARIVLSTSHLRPGKGVELLPALAEALPPDACVALAGDGDLRAGLQAAARQLGLDGSRFRLLGVREDVPRLLAAADLYVFPTHGNEGLGLAPLEAAAAGVPVVASAVSDLPQLLGDAARFVPPGDVGALIGECRAILADERTASVLRAAGPARAREQLHVDRAARDHVAAYLR